MRHSIPTLLIAFLLTSAYWVTRLANLTLLPIFNDEAQYLHWVLLMTQDMSNMWVSLKADNNKPLLYWLIGLIYNYFDDPLIAGRVVSVVAGYFSMAGLYLIVCRLLSRQAGVTVCIFFIVSPWHLFFNRLVHKASFLNCFFVWYIWLTIIAFHGDKKLSWKYCLLMAGTIGLSLLTESTAILFVFIQLLFKLVYFKDEKLPGWRTWALIYFPGIGIGMLPYLYLYSMDASFQVNNIFVPKVHGLSNVGAASLFLGIPRTALSSVNDVMSYFTVYLTWPVLLLSVAWFIINLRNHSRSLFVMTAFFVLPLIVLMGTAGRGYSRYYLFCSTPILICGAMAFADMADMLKRVIKNHYVHKVITLIVLIIVLLPSARLDYNLLTQPQSADLVVSDRYQYVTGEFSGYGIPEAVAYLKSESKKQRIVVFTTQNWGNPEDAVAVYFSNHPNIDVYMAPWVIDTPLLPPNATGFKIFQKYTDKFLKRISVGEMEVVYFICKSTTCARDVFLKNNPNFQLVKVFGKPEGIHFYEIYKSIQAVRQLNG